MEYVRLVILPLWRLTRTQSSFSSQVSSIFGTFFPPALVDEQHEQQTLHNWAAEGSTGPQPGGKCSGAQAVCHSDPSPHTVLILSRCYSLISVAYLGTVCCVCWSLDKKLGIMNRYNPQIILSILINPLGPLDIFSFVSSAAVTWSGLLPSCQTCFPQKPH